jgi:hypothetical protein
MTLGLGLGFPGSSGLVLRLSFMDFSPPTYKGAKVDFVNQ